jgi:hypothetical protein
MELRRFWNSPSTIRRSCQPEKGHWIQTPWKLRVTQLLIFPAKISTFYSNAEIFSYSYINELHLLGNPLYDWALKVDGSFSHSSYQRGDLHKIPFQNATPLSFSEVNGPPISEWYLISMTPKPFPRHYFHTKLNYYRDFKIILWFHVNRQKKRQAVYV